LIKILVQLLCSVELAAGEFFEHGKDFKSISKKTGIKTKNIDAMSVYLS
jgi:hypothetical protein